VESDSEEAAESGKSGYIEAELDSVITTDASALLDFENA
jgi:hypothetical protein